MSILSQSASAAMDGVAIASTVGDHLDEAATNPVIVDTLGQENVDRLLAGAKAVLDGAGAAAQALYESVNFDALDAKADALMAKHADASEVTDFSIPPEAVDVDKLRAGTAKLQAAFAQAHELGDTVEQMLGDEQIVSRAREQFGAAVGASGEEVDLEAIKGALASIQPGNIAIAGEIGAAIDHVSAAGKDLPPDAQGAVQHLQATLNDSLGELGRLTERARDVSIAAVDRLA
jgi:hypothetical protein